MTEIINWNDLWKLKILSSPLRKTLEEDAGSLGDKYAKRCSEFSLQNKENTGKEIAKIDAASKGCVYLFTLAGRGTDEAIWKETYNERYSAWANYVYLYNILHDLGIYANVKIWNSEFEQRYNSLDDAVNEWKEMYSIPSEKESILREHLSRMLVEDDGTLCLNHKYKRAMIWWRKE